MFWARTKREPFSAPTVQEGCPVASSSRVCWPPVTGPVPIAAGGHPTPPLLAFFFFPFFFFLSSPLFPITVPYSLAVAQPTWECYPESIGHLPNTGRTRGPRSEPVGTQPGPNQAGAEIAPAIQEGFPVALFPPSPSQAASSGWVCLPMTTGLVPTLANDHPSTSPSPFFFLSPPCLPWQWHDRPGMGVRWGEGCPNPTGCLPGASRVQGRWPWPGEPMGTLLGLIQGRSRLGSQSAPALAPNLGHPVSLSSPPPPTGYWGISLTLFLLRPKAYWTVMAAMMMEPKKTMEGKDENQSALHYCALIFFLRKHR